MSGTRAHAAAETAEVVIVDLGSANLGNLARGLALAGASPRITRDPAAIARARKLVLPGVGAFGPARERLRGEVEAAVRTAVATGAWLFGICLGYQLLFASSEESGGAEGLALLHGHVRRLPGASAAAPRVLVPHVGWNTVRRRAAHPLLDAYADGAAGYYVHAYAPFDVPADEVFATTVHGVEFAAAAARGRVAGVQFHPERGGEAGMALLRRFVALGHEVTSEGPAVVAATTAPSPRRQAEPPRGFDLFPALDLRNGRVVRLLHGDDAARTAYDEDPLAVARAYARDGARWLHVVDLDAAFGEPAQDALLAALLALPGRPRVQLGGGLRDAAAVERALARGVERVVVGSLVARDPAAFRAVALAHPGRVVPALDVAASRVRVSGWREEGPSWQEVASQLRSLPCAAVLVTSVERDGAMAGADLELAVAIARASGIPALLSGGVRDLGELARAARRRELAGAVVGRALYEGAFSLREALTVTARTATARGVRRGGEPEPSTGLLARVIPCLDVANGRVVKGVRFQDLVDQGSPAEAARRYERQGADELVLLDIGAAPDGRDTRTEWVEAVARELCIPLTVGGGVRSLDDALRLLGAGADKIAVNTAAVERPELLDEIAVRCGEQCLVLAVDAARVPAEDASAPPRWEVRTHGGRRGTGRDAMAWIREGVTRGAGEVLLTSVDADGTRAGYDLELLRASAAAVDVPVIASGGAGTVTDLARALRAGASAVLAASMFHQGDVTVGEAKEYLAARGVAVRSARSGELPDVGAGLAPARDGSPHHDRTLRTAGDLDALRFDDRGLLPAIAQDVATGAVRMVAWANREALARTLETGSAWFWSRSRQELWQKGATSGSALHVVEARPDCDGDAVLLRVRAAGPSCHTGATSCFGEPAARLELGWLSQVIASRRDAAPQASYTARLLAAGAPGVAQKVGEEASEVIVAALAQTPERLAEEAADLLYHLLVLLAARGVDPRAVATVLARRHAETPAPSPSHQSVDDGREVEPAAPTIAAVAEEVPR